MTTGAFWALVSLIIFLLILVYYKVPGLLSNALDGRAKRIAEELEEARRLREEAQQLLAGYEKKRAEAENEAGEILRSAERRAELIVADMRKDTEAYLARCRKMAEQRIAEAESEAVQAIRSAAADKAVKAAAIVLRDKLKNDAERGRELFDRSLQEVEMALKKAS